MRAIESVGENVADGSRSGARDDRDLVSAIRDGDRSAFAVLYRRHVRAVHAYVSSVLQDWTDAEDVTQETFVTAWERIDGDAVFDRSALPWLLTTARYKSFNRNRAQTRQARRESASSVGDLPLTGNGVDAVVLHAELWQVLTSAVEALSHTDRTIYEICLVDGSTYAEAAEALGVTPGSVRNRLSRIRRRLRDELAILKGNASTLQPLDDHSVDRMLADAYSAITTRERRRTRRHRIIAGIAACVLTLGVTGGALAITQATGPMRDVAECYSAADLNSTHTGAALLAPDGEPSPTFTNAASRISAGLDMCGAVWRAGRFETTGAGGGSDFAVPNLVACTLEDGRFGYFPSNDPAPQVCANLGLSVAGH